MVGQTPSRLSAMTFYDFCSSLKSSLISTSRSSAILTKVSIGGWQALVHHLLTVVGAQPNCSDNHLLVLFLSASTTFIRFSILFFWSYCSEIWLNAVYLHISSLFFNQFVTSGWVAPYNIYACKTNYFVPKQRINICIFVIYPVLIAFSSLSFYIFTFLVRLAEKSATIGRNLTQIGH